jgi:hypothetical protein
MPNRSTMKYVYEGVELNATLFGHQLQEREGVLFTEAAEAEHRHLSDRQFGSLMIMLISPGSIVKRVCVSFLLLFVHFG